MEIVYVLPIAIWALSAFGILALVAWLAVAGFQNLSRGKTLTAVLCFLGVLACPAYHYYDWHRGDTLGASWTELKVTGKPDRYDPVVLVTREARYCDLICREVLARGFVDRITLAQEHPPGSGKAKNIFTHRMMRDHRCAGDSQQDQPIQRIDDRNREQCIVGYRSSIPATHTRITYSETPYPRVRQAGFPVLSSNNIEGTYFLIVERVSGTRVDLIAQSFRQVRQPMPLIYGLQFLAPESPRFRQTVGAKADRNEALNRIMGWSMKGRLPANDPKPAAAAFPPGTPTILVCDEKKVPISCELKLAPKS